jgi:hypothetical protein
MTLETLAGLFVPGPALGLDAFASPEGLKEATDRVGGMGQDGQDDVLGQDPA